MNSEAHYQTTIVQLYRRRDRAPRVELFPLSYTHDRFSLLLLVDNSRQLQTKSETVLVSSAGSLFFYMCNGK